jgi:hypothetical protein
LHRQVFSENYVHWSSVETGKQTKVSNVHIEYAGFYENLLLFLNQHFKAFRCTAFFLIRSTEKNKVKDKDSRKEKWTKRIEGNK